MLSGLVTIAADAETEERKMPMIPLVLQLTTLQCALLLLREDENAEVLNGVACYHLSVSYCACMCVYVSVCVSECVYLCVYVCLCARESSVRVMCMCVVMCVCVCVCVCVCE
jgi:hypothetical protein